VESVQKMKNKQSADRRKARKKRTHTRKKRDIKEG
jgi:hypothetical protein